MSSRNNSHLVLLIILWVGRPQLGHSSAPGGVGVATVLQRFTWAEALRWQAHMAGGRCWMSLKTQIELLMGHLGSPHGPLHMT